MDWQRLQHIAGGAFAIAIGATLAVVGMLALLVGCAHLLTFIAERT